MIRSEELLYHVKHRCKVRVTERSTLMPKFFTFHAGGQIYKEGSPYNPDLQTTLTAGQLAKPDYNSGRQPQFFHGGAKSLLKWFIKDRQASL